MNRYTIAAALLLAALASCTIPIFNSGPLVPLTADQNASINRMQITVAGKTRWIHYETSGNSSKPVLMVVHGSAADSRAYSVLSYLSDKYYIVFWDQRGAGLSERITKEEYSWKYVVDEIKAVKNAFSPNNPVTLVGHSWGAAYIPLYISTHPADVAQAVLAEPGPALNNTIFQKTINTLFTLNLAEPVYNDIEVMNDYITAWDHEQMDYRYLMNLHNPMLNYFKDKTKIPDWPIWRPGAYLEYIRQSLIMAEPDNFNFASGLQAYTTPVQILAAPSAYSALGYDFQVNNHKGLFVDANVTLIEDSGHRMFTEQPGKVITAIRGYLSEYQ